MPQKLDIHLGKNHVGWWQLEEDNAALARHGGAQQIVDGVLLSFPSTLTVECEAPELLPEVGNLSLVVYFGDKNMFLGKTEELDPPLNGYQGTEGGTSYFPHLTLRASPEALAYIEAHRGNRGPRFRVRCQGEVWGRLHDGYSAWADKTLRTASQRFRWETEVQYAHDGWVERIRQSGFGSNVLVETPIPGTPDEKFVPIVKELAQAQAALLNSGNHAWSSVLIAIRRALEAWAELEREPAPSAPNLLNREARESMSQRERRDYLRVWLHQFCHPGAHENPDQFTRADALLAINTLAGLLHARLA